MSAGYNWALIVITLIVALVSVAVSLYALVLYQHPEDKNQAWLPKVVVIFSLSLAIWTVLLFPLDIANTQSCDASLPASYCTFAIPAKQLWFACYIANAVLVFGVIPFASFYYEADSELCVTSPFTSSHC